MKFFQRTMLLAAMGALALAVSTLAGCSKPDPTGPDSPNSTVDPASLYNQTKPSTSGADNLGAAPGPDQTDQTTSDHPAWATDDDGVPWGWNGSGLVATIGEQFMPSNEQRKLIYDASAAAMAACIQGKGLKYWSQPWADSTADQPGLLFDADSPLGLLDPEYGAVWGYAYGVNWNYTPKPFISAPAEYADQDPAALDQAQSQCFDDPAVLALAPAENADLFDAIREIQDRANATAAGDTKFVAATKDWSACMSQSGYAYQSPIEPWQEYAKDRQTPSPGDATPELPPDDQFFGVKPETKELDTAKADLACKAETNIIGLYRQTLWAAQQTEIDSNRPTLEAFQASFASQLSAAEAYFVAHPATAQSPAIAP